MFKIECDEEIWEYVFTRTDSGLSEEGREDFVREAIRTYRRGDRAKKIKGDGFEGYLKKGERFLLGCFGGQFYEAKIETDHGKRNIGVLINELLDINRN